MNITFRGHKIYVDRNTKNEYPRFSIALAMLLLYVAPFVSMWLAVPSFIICIYRTIRYDVKVFATDFGALLPLVALTKLPDVPALLVYWILLAGIWHFVRGGMRKESSFILLIVLANYLLTRMQMELNTLVLMFGPLFVVCLILPKQDEISAERTIKMFITSLIISSIYAFLLRDTAQIRAICGADAYAFFGSNVKRFKGLLQDPNYYMTLVVIAIALLMKMKECNLVTMGQFLVQGLVLVTFGMLTYSKTFFLVFILLAALYVYWQFRSKKIVSGMAWTTLALASAAIILFANISPFEVIIERFTSAKSIRDLTTGRSELILYYWRAITQDVQSFFFGKGLGAAALWKDPHNIYLEAMYYLGVVGFGLILSVCIHLVREAKMRVPQNGEHWISKYMVLLMLLVLYCSLHGLFQVSFYGELFFALLSLTLVKRKDQLIVESSEE